MTEKFTQQSPYVYADNNPVRYIDYMGMNAREEVDGEDDDEEEKKYNWIDYLISYYQSRGYDVETLDDVQSVIDETKEEFSDWGIKQEDVDFAGNVVSGFSTIFGSAAHLSDLSNIGRKFGIAGTAANLLTYGHAEWTEQAEPSHRLDATITTGILGLTIFPPSTKIGVTAGVIYGGVRLIGGQWIDQEFNKWYYNKYKDNSEINKKKP